jgi:hypothetical protein
MSCRRSRAARMLVGAVLAAVATGVSAQIAVRPDDPWGLSIRERRVRVIHSDSPEVPGTSMHLQMTGPWLAYQRGRSYFFREWSVAEGVFGRVAQRSVAAATNSCGMCHNLPFRTPGAGGNTAEPAGHGRNTPHLFGAGLLEMIGQQIHHRILAELDLDRNGFLDVPAETAGRRIRIEAAPGTWVDFGSLDDRDGDGLPDVNRVLQVRFVDADGRLVLRGPEGRPARLGDPGVAGFDLLPGIFASSAGDHQFPTLRVFSNGALRTVMGIPSDDPTSFQELGPRPAESRDGVWARTSNAGMPQPNLQLIRSSRQAQEVALADLAGSMGEGESDLLEWYLLNHPPPAVDRQTEQTRRGRELLATFGCTACHVPDWVLAPADPESGWPGDRRFFHLEVSYDTPRGGLQGRVIDKAERVEGPGGILLHRPRGEGFTVRGVYTDLRHHDLGERFYESHYFRGRLHQIREFRTPPLWGVGSTAPYGHDGRSATLDDVIRRHGGEAEASREAWIQATEADRAAVLAFLRSLVLYQPDVLPTDLDGDGEIAQEHEVAGLPVGPERLQPELLFRVPPRYRGWVEDPDHGRWFSYELLNQREAYGEGLAALVDRDGNMLPDLPSVQPEGPRQADVADDSVEQER